MADEKMIDRAEHVLYKTYNRFPVVFDHGKGTVSYTHLTLPTKLEV